MSDDLIKRLTDAARPTQYGGGGGELARDKALLIAAAAALAEAQAEIARLRRDARTFARCAGFTEAEIDALVPRAALDDKHG